MFDSISRALVLAPHTDDAELGCGGTIARLVAQGCAVHVAAFSIARESLPDGFAENVLESEFADSMDVLNVPASNRRLFDYPVRHFPEHRQAILEDLVRLRAEWQPELVFLPSASDVHQDHATIHQEGFRAFKKCGVLGYEMPWNQVGFSSDLIVGLDRKQVDRKCAALAAYKSQLAKNVAYFQTEFIESLARVRGAQSPFEFAEAFEVLRLYA